MKEEDSLLDDPEDRDSGGDSDEVSTLPRCFQQTAQFDRCHFEKDWTQMIHDPNCAAQLCITFYFLNLLPVFLHAALCHFHFDKYCT